ncbi:Processing alpha glucosidase I [Coemansia sp. S146]|nr:Processing alpha glucosidase I [Coemansia sp. S146]
MTWNPRHSDKTYSNNSASTKTRAVVLGPRLCYALVAMCGMQVDQMAGPILSNMFSTVTGEDLHLLNVVTKHGVQPMAPNDICRMVKRWVCNLSKLLAKNNGMEQSLVAARDCNVFYKGQCSGASYGDPGSLVAKCILTGKRFCSLVCLGIQDDDLRELYKRLVGIVNKRTSTHTKECLEQLTVKLRHSEFKNGRDFGEQTTRDSDQGIEINSTFIKVPGQLGGSWAVRFTGRTLNEDTQGVSLVYYFGLEGNGTLSTSVKDDVAMVRGRTPSLGKFCIHIVPAHINQFPVVPEDFRNIGGIHSSKISGVGLKVLKTDVWKAKDAFQDVLLASAQTRARAMSKRVPTGKRFCCWSYGLYFDGSTKDTTPGGK